MTKMSRLADMSEVAHENWNVRTLDRIQHLLQIDEGIAKTLPDHQSVATASDAELTARKKQYAYYRDRILSFGEDV